MIRGSNVRTRKRPWINSQRSTLKLKNDWFSVISVWTELKHSSLNRHIQASKNQTDLNFRFQESQRSYKVMPYHKVHQNNRSRQLILSARLIFKAMAWRLMVKGKRIRRTRQLHRLLLLKTRWNSVWFLRLRRRPSFYLAGYSYKPKHIPD